MSANPWVAWVGVRGIACVPLGAGSCLVVSRRSLSIWRGFYTVLLFRALAQCAVGDIAGESDRWHPGYEGLRGFGSSRRWLHLWLL